MPKLGLRRAFRALAATGGGRVDMLTNLDSQYREHGPVGIDLGPATQRMNQAFEHMVAASMSRIHLGILLRYRLEVPQSYTMSVQQAPISKPRYGLPVRFRPLTA
jgi:hypothetical protein